MNTYDVIIIGGGASGTALLYTLAKYTDIKRIALIEKYATFGSVNSNAKNNSQTLHVGDIETNYTIDKVKSVKPASMMIPKYAERLSPEESSKFLFSVPKMILAVGEDEVVDLEKRFIELKSIFPELERLTVPDIAKLEPKVIEGRNSDENLMPENVQWSSPLLMVNSRTASRVSSEKRTAYIKLPDQVSTAPLAGAVVNVTTPVAEIEAGAVRVPLT